MVKVLPAEGFAGELPVPFVATTVNDPTALEANVSVMVAEVPFELIFTLDALMAAGVKVGKKEKVAPERFEPSTWKLIVGVFGTRVGLTEVTTGLVSTMKLLLEVAVELPTATLMGPVVAPGGTVVVSRFAVAAVTLATVPLNLTVLEPGVALKFWPWMVTVCPTIPTAGAKLVIASALGEDVELVIEIRFPTAS
jgi:hypothetical protein